MAAYSYDETGAYNFFLITFLTFLLFPWTYFALFRSGSAADRATSKVKPPAEGWNTKHDSVRRSRKRGVGLSKTNALLALGWVAFAFVLQRAYTYESNTTLYDPFKILGISTGLAEKDIKRHYRKLSLKFHPDKLQLAENQTKEEADAHFVELTKAYKALTDETVRQNYEQYGHPDGKQEFSMGIALPKWIIESKNSGYVLSVYGLIFGILLPYAVGAWWYGSRRITKDGVLTATAGLYFRSLKEDHNDIADIIAIISNSVEFDAAHNKLMKKNAKGKSAQAHDRLQNQVREAMKKVTEDKLDGDFYKTVASKRVAILIYAHLLRVPIGDVSLLREKNAVVERSSKLVVSLMNIALSHNWLGTYLTTVAFQQHLIQAFHPALSPVLQLPEVTVEQANALAHEAGIVDIKTFVKSGSPKKREILRDLGDKKVERIERVAQNWPTLEVVDAKFQVVGEKVVTPGSFVQLIVKVKITPPSSLNVPELQVNDKKEELTEVEEGEEKDLDELIGRVKKGANGETPDAFVHAPYFPKNRKPMWYLFVGDHKLGRVFVQPISFNQFGYNKVRTLQTTFQAPPNPGLYTFQTYVKSSSYVGTDAQVDMMMQVQQPAEPSAEDDDDDISEPDEDTIAGAMAQMRGQPVKRIDGEEEYEEDEDEETSGSEEETESSDSSDSDSD